MSMISQGFPLWATVDDPGLPGVYVVTSWDEHGYPILVAVGRAVARRTGTPSDRVLVTFHTTDPTTQESREPAPDDLRQRVAGLADKLEGLSVPQMASVIRDEVLSPVQPAPDDLRQRMAALADQVEQSERGDWGPATMSARIRQELDK